MGIMRLLLAVTVLLWHCPEGLVSRMLHPALAVQCFYSISGFLMQMVISSGHHDAPGWQVRFYISRFLRIYPLYIVFVALTVLFVGYHQLTFLLSQHFWHAAALWIANNALIVGQDVLRFFYFDAHAGHFSLLPRLQEERVAVQPISVSMTALGQSWTLAIELYFYAIVPFLLTRRTRVLAAVILLSLGLRIYLGYHGYFQSEWIYGFFPSELGVFLLGSLAYRAYFFLFESGRLAWRLERMGSAGERILLALCAVVVAYVSWIYMTIDLNFAGGQSQWGAAPMGVARGYWFILLMTILALPCAFYFSRKCKWDRFIGELSYPVYISHFLVLQLITQRLHPAESATPLIGLFVLVISLLLSVALLQFVEQPIDRLRHRIFQRRRAAVH